MSRPTTRPGFVSPHRVIKRLSPLLALLGVAVLAYAVLIPQMGFYWDELPMTWIRYELGPAAMTRYFSTNRPVWGLLYQASTRLLPQVPIYWQIFALLWRWLSAVLAWAIVRLLWPERRLMALATGWLFLVYPGFNQQWTAYLYSHFFIVLCFLLLSWLCMLRSFHPEGSLRNARLLMLAALLLSALNLWMMEYFFVLELLRPLLILQFVSRARPDQALKPRLRQTLARWLPYFAVFIANILWRLFIFNNQIYRPTLLSSLQTSPLAAGLELLRTVVQDLYEVSAAAWAQVFHFPQPAVDGPRTTLFYMAVVLLTALLAGWALLASRGRDQGSEPRTGPGPVALGLMAMVVAGGPFWLAGLDITLGHPANRFTLPFMFGVSLLLAGLLQYLPQRVTIVIVTALVALAAGRQALWADAFRRDWATQRALFWQMYWRAPAIQPNTIVLMNEGPLQFYADNSLTAALNWIYDPANRSSAMDYVLFYPTSRLGGSLPDLSAGQAITYDFISEVFHGSTSQTLAFEYAPPGCLRLLDPALDADNRLIADDSLMRQAALLSSSRWILGASDARMPGIYGPEPAHGWCYYFEKAQLAAQVGDWPRVVQLGEQALKLDDYPNDPVERFVFVEGYARSGDWKQAGVLAMQSYRVSPRYVGPLLCKLVERLGGELAATPASQSGLNDLRTRFSCLP